MNGAVLVAIGLIVWFLDAMGTGFAFGVVAGAVIYQTLHRIIYGSWL